MSIERLHFFQSHFTTMSSLTPTETGVVEIAMAYALTAYATVKAKFKLM